MMDVTALGELLIDFTPAGNSENGNARFERNPGGAPANVLAALAKLGKKGAFIGKVGDDQFGRFLESVLRDNGIDTSGLVLSREYQTTLAFVHLNPDGDRSFSFYRRNGADMMLEEKEVRYDLIKGAKIFHFGSVSMTDDPSRTATLKAASYAKQQGVLVSYDPNLRLPLWSDASVAKQTISEGLRFADILKISEEELEFLTGAAGLSEGSETLFAQYRIPLILVTLGEKGCFIRKGNETAAVQGYPVKAVDTTGAGDGFLGGMLYQLLESGVSLDQLSMERIADMVRFANAVGALATTKKGAIPAMPTLEEVRALMRADSE